MAVFMPGLTPVLAQGIAVTHCQGQCPRYDSTMAANRANIVVHHLFAAGVNGDTGLPDWVAYQLTPAAVGVASLLPREWQPDPLVEFSDASELMTLGNSEISLAEVSRPVNAYSGLNESTSKHEDRARLVPMTSFANTPYWYELNNLSNMVPMPSALRLGAWLQLEQAVNQVVVRKEQLYVVSGPLFLINQALNSGDSAAAFDPAAYFKVVVGANGYAAFVFREDLDQHESFCSQRGELEQIQRMTGLKLFPEREIRQSATLLAELGCQG